MNFHSVFITGISSGIGESLCQHFLECGSVVYGVSRRTPRIEHPNLHFAAADITDYTASSETIESLLTEVSQLDLVILNAGVLGQIADMGDQNTEQMKMVMNTNLWANKPVLDTLHKSCEINQVVAVSSGAAVNGNRGWGGYSLSKAALNMMIQLYAAENASTHYTALAPGLVDTAMQEFLCTLPQDERYPSVKNIVSKRGSEWMPSPEEAAKKLVGVMEKLPEWSESGGFVDVRKTEGWMSV